MNEGNIGDIESNGKFKKTKIFGIIIMLFLAIFTITYFINDTFKHIANSLLTDVPILGKIVSSQPTELEVNEREEEIARYYVEDLDPKSASDKLYIIKTEDAALYNRLTKRMNGISVKRTDKVLEEIRNIEIRSDFLTDIYKEVQDEKVEELKKKAKELESIGARAAINKIMEGSAYKEGEVERLFLYLNDKAAVDILYYLDGGSKSDFLYKLSEINMKRKNDLEKLLSQKRTEELEKDGQAAKLANVHSASNPKESAVILGTDEEIDINVLARTFMMMPEKAAAEIIVNIKEEEFTKKLYAEIEKEEMLRGIEQSSLVLISQIKAYILEYEKNLQKLSKVYQRMDSKAAADSLTKLLANENELTVLQIREQEGYQLSDYIVAVDIMKRMRDANLKDVFENMPSEEVARITRILSER